MIYVLDDEDFHYNIVRRAFPDKEVLHFRDSKSFLRALKSSKKVDLVVIDLHIDFDDFPRENFVGNNPGVEGILVADRVRKKFPDIPIVLSTRYAEADIFMRANYLRITPIEIVPENPELGVQKLRELFPELTEKRKDDEKLLDEYREAGFVTKSRKILEILKLLEKWKDLDEPILITGETGTGKDTLAKAVHRRSRRRSEPYINFVISAYPKENLHSKLFGVKNRAFTGVDATPGVLEAVGEGTLILNEIGDLDIDAQIELLQVIEEREFTRMQSHHPIKFKGRFILLTHKNIEKLIQEGKFRKDLYRRIMGFHVEIPPLRERREDIPLLIKYFVPELSFTGTALDFLVNDFDYPENVGSLYKISMILKSLLTDRNIVTLDDVIKAISLVHPVNGDMKAGVPEEITDLVLDFILSHNLTLKKFEQLIVEKAYERFGSVWRKNTWGKLGIPRTTFYRKRK